MQPAASHLPFNPKRCGRVFCKSSCLLLALCLGSNVTSQGQVKEYDLKAALLYHLARFVEWPPAAFSTPQSPIIIGIVGRDPFGRVLDTTVQRETVGGRRIVVERYRTPGGIQPCHILFVSSSEKGELKHIFTRIKDQPTLTVADFDDFSTEGGMVTFVRNEEGKIRLKINLGAVRAQNIKLSARLLQVAEIVPAKN